jgi:hypothetical protein
MWLSAAHAAAPHRSKPGEERHHLPGHQELFSRRQDLSSTAHRPMRGPRAIRAAHYSRPAIRAGRCRPEAAQAASCARRAARAGHCALRGIRVGHCRLAEAIRRVLRSRARQMGGRTLTLARQAGMSRRCRRGSFAAPACRRLRVPARLRHPCPMRSACRRSISAARLRPGRGGDRRRAQPRRLRRPEAGRMLCRQNHPTGRRRGARPLEGCSAAALLPDGWMSRWRTCQAPGDQRRWGTHAAGARRAR